MSRKQERITLLYLCIYFVFFKSKRIIKWSTETLISFSLKGGTGNNLFNFYYRISYFHACWQSTGLTLEMFCCNSSHIQQHTLKCYFCTYSVLYVPVHLCSIFFIWEKISVCSFLFDRSIFPLKSLDLFQDGKYFSIRFISCSCIKRYVDIVLIWKNVKLRKLLKCNYEQYWIVLYLVSVPYNCTGTVLCFECTSTEKCSNS